MRERVEVLVAVGGGVVRERAEPGGVLPASGHQQRDVRLTPNPAGEWMGQQARNLCMYWQDQPKPAGYLIHDRDNKFTAQFDAIVESDGIGAVRLTPGSTNMNAYAERWVQSLKHECLNHFIVLGERHLRHIVHQYVQHYHLERPRQAKDNAPLSGAAPPTSPDGEIIRHERLVGPLKHYTRRAA